jgi:phosphoglycolate phosphatase-like HAD superfamily hydrolase
VRPPTVLLFDIDGTLVSMKGCGRRALARAFGAEFGRPDVFDGFEFGGQTDPAIVRHGLLAAGAVTEPAAITRMLAMYVAHLEDEVRRSTDCLVHPGVAPVLDAAAATPGIAVGLGTGNVRAGARAKLERLGLAHHFAFGGFGCDHEDRARLLDVGAGRGAAHLGVPRERCRVVVIGDTPRDVAAGRAIGAETVAVGTSAFAPETLRAAGATAAFPDLTAPGALEAILG